MLSKLCIVFAVVLPLSMSAECRAEELPENFPDDIPIAKYMEVTNVIFEELYKTEAGRNLGLDDTLMVYLSASDKPISDVVIWFRDRLTDADWWLLEERAQPDGGAMMLFRKDERLSIVDVTVVYVRLGGGKCGAVRESPRRRIHIELTSVESYMRRGVPPEDTVNGSTR